MRRRIIPASICPTNWPCRLMRLRRGFTTGLPANAAQFPPSEVEAFGIGPYRDALTKGTDLTDSEEQQVAEKLHEYTGVPADYWTKANLRVSGPEFEKALLAGQNETTGRLDTRFSGP